MKYFKKMTALLLALALMLTTVSAASIGRQEAEKLNKMGLLLNISQEELDQGLNRAIGLAMVLKAVGYSQEEANKKADQTPFKDLEDPSFSWAKGYTALAQEKKITKGKSETAFAPGDKLTKQELVTFMLRVLGYDTNLAWTNAGSLGKEAGLVDSENLADANFTKGEAAQIMYRAMDAKIYSSKTRLIEKLVADGDVKEADAIAVGLIEAKPVVKEFELEKIVADNLRQVELKFTRELNKAVAENKANYRIKGRTISSAKLADDKMSVILTIGTGNNPVVLNNQTRYKLTVSNIEDVNGQKLAKIEREFDAFDKFLPQVEEIRISGPSILEIKFSEPIKSMDRAKVLIKRDNRSTMSVKSLEINGADVKLETYSRFETNTDYTITVAGAKDYADYLNEVREETFTYQEDKSEIQASVISVDEKNVVVEFNKPVKGLTRGHFYHSFNAWEPKAIYKDEEMTKMVNQNEYLSKVYIRFANSSKDGYPLVKDTEFVIRDKNSSGTKIVDAWNNQLSTQKINISVAVDNTPPRIESTEQVSGKELKITYDKAISESGRYKLLDTSGRTAASVSVSKSGRTVTLRFSSDQEGKTRILEISGVKDDTIGQNEMPTQRLDLTFEDSVFEGVEKVHIMKTANSGTIYVQYKEDVDANTALNKENYVIAYNNSDKARPTENIEFFSGSRTVAIELTKDQANKIGQASKLTITNVRDLAGNAIFAETFAISSTSETVKVTGIVLTKNNEIEVAYDGQILEAGIPSTYKVSGGQVYEDAMKLTTNNLEVIDASLTETNKVRLTLNKQVYTNTSLVLSTNQGPDSGPMDVFGKKTETITNRSVDKDEVAGVIARVSQNQANSSPDYANKEGERDIYAYKDGGEYKIAIAYTEPINQSTVSTVTYIINDDFRIDTVTATDNKVILTVIPETKDGVVRADFAADLWLTQKYSVRDMAGNEVLGSDGSANTTSMLVIKADSWK